MWEERADRARPDIAALVVSGPGISGPHAEAIRVVERTVTVDLTCWAAIDPETLVISNMIGGENRIPPEYEPRLVAAEYSHADEPNRFATLVRRRQPTARLSDLSARERERSERLAGVWRPLGLDRELRVVFLADGAWWGGAGMVRAGHDFTDREMEFLIAVAPAVAGATRLAMRTDPQHDTARRIPAVVVVGPDGELRTMTAAAREWREALDELAPDRFSVMMAVMAVGARTAGAGIFRARVQDRRGQWALLRASPLIGDGDQIAVVIEPASGQQVLGILLAAYALTSRERDVCREVIAGFSTIDSQPISSSPPTPCRTT